METEVEWYAGTRYPERPRTFLYRGWRLRVEEVEWRERTPRGIRFRVRVGDGRRFSLFYDEAQDTGSVRRLASA